MFTNAVRRLVVAGAIFLSFAASLAFTSTIPNVNFEVTFRQKEEGKFSQGLHVLNLFCYDQKCTLIYLSLNQCMKFMSSNSFYPKMELFSTDGGDLQVYDLGNTIHIKHLNGLANVTLRFSYERTGSEPMGIISDLTGFSGGFVKDSVILKKVVTAEYVPLEGRTQYITMDCSVMLSGIPTEDEQKLFK